MSRLNELSDDPPKDEKPVYGIPLGGVFECECGVVATQAYYMRREEAIAWKCPECGEVSKIRSQLDL